MIDKMKDSTYKSSKHKAITKIAICLVILSIVTFLLFPRKYELKDGGSVLYASFGLGVIYKVEQLHRLSSIEGKTGYETGTIVYIFNLEIYKNTSVEYTTPENNVVPPELIESLNEELFN